MTNTICVRVPHSLAPTAEDKLRLLQELKLHALELSNEEAPLQALSMGEVLDLRALLIDEGCTVPVYSTPLRHLDEGSVTTLLRHAHLLEVERLSCDPDGCSDDEIGRFFDAARCFGIGVMVENRAGTPLGEVADIERFLRRFAHVPCGLAFDPLEFVRLRKHPFFHVYYASRLKNRIGLLRLHDGLYGDGRPVPLGHGNGEVKELVSIMKARSYGGLWSVTPYLPGASASHLADAVRWLRETLKGI